jgi:hypothetical protein
MCHPRIGISGLKKGLQMTAGSVKIWIKQAADLFDRYIGQYGEHAVGSRGEVYIQPYVDLSMHLIQMQLEGWTDVDFDYLAAVSGASALYGYQPGDFMPKYAHLRLAPEGRIADATGFGYKWEAFKDAEEAWKLLKQTVDGGHIAKGWDWENILFAGYKDAPTIEARKVFAMADGPGTYVKWLDWDEFGEWVQRILDWHSGVFGLFTERVDAHPRKKIALRVLRDLVAWSEKPPEDIVNWHSDAKFGFEAIEAQAKEVEDTEKFPDFISCHGLNPQWAIRRSTALYLEDLVKSAMFPDEVNSNLGEAAQQYHASFTTWKAFYTMVGHHVPDEVRNMPDRRHAAAGLVRCWGAHERTAVDALEKALQLL